MVTERQTNVHKPVIKKNQVMLLTMMITTLTVAIITTMTKMMRMTMISTTPMIQW